MKLEQVKLQHKGANEENYLTDEEISVLRQCRIENVDRSVHCTDATMMRLAQFGLIEIHPIANTTRKGLALTGLGEKTLRKLEHQEQERAKWDRDSEEASPFNPGIADEASVPLPAEAACSTDEGPCAECDAIPLEHLPSEEIARRSVRVLATDIGSRNRFLIRIGPVGLLLDLHDIVVADSTAKKVSRLLLLQAEGNPAKLIESMIQNGLVTLLDSLNAYVEVKPEATDKADCKTEPAFACNGEAMYGTKHSE